MTHAHLHDPTNPRRFSASKRRLSILLALCLILSSVSWTLTVIAEDARTAPQATQTDPQISPIAEGDAPDVTEAETELELPEDMFVCDSRHGAHGFVALTQDSPLLDYTTLGSGHYYLSEDIQCGFRIWDGSDVTICLNGHTFSGYNQAGVITYETATVRPPILLLGEGTTLTICDCVGGGVIQNSNNPAVVVDEYEGGPTLNLVGGTIYSPTHIDLSLRDNSTFRMYGGEIEGVNVGAYSTAEIYDGTIGKLAAQRAVNQVWSHDAVIHIYGGTIGTVTAQETDVLMTGGEVTEWVNVGTASNFHMQGGIVNGITHSDGALTLYGGKVGEIYLGSSDTVPQFTVNGLPDAPILVRTYGSSIYRPDIGKPVPFANFGAEVEPGPDWAQWFYSDYSDRAVCYDSETQMLNFSIGLDLWVNDVQVTDLNRDNVLDEQTASGQPTVVFDEESYRLHVYDLKLGKNGADRPEYAIYSSGSDTTYTVEFHGESELYGDTAAVSGVNVVVPENASLALHGGVHALELAGELTVDGTLIATGDKAGISASDSSWYSQYIYGAGTVTANGGEDGIRYSYEPDSLYRYLNIGLSATGKLYATGETGHGIAADGLAISDGTVVATGSADGILLSSGMSMSGGDITATGGQNGVNAYSSINIEGGILKATGANGYNGIYIGETYETFVLTGGQVSVTSSGTYSAGLNVFATDIRGGELTATAEGEDSCGICVAEYEQSAGTVNATATGLMDGACMPTIWYIPAVH